MLNLAMRYANEDDHTASALEADLARSHDRPSAVSSLGSSFDRLLAQFAPITLDVVKSVAVANRLDAKFAFGIAALPDLLEVIRPCYSLLTIGGVRAQRYQTVYFDTPNLDLYLRHHSGIYPRHKIRCRRYVDSNLCFLEVKTKRNTGRTVKQRVPAPSIEAEVLEESRAFLRYSAPSLPIALAPVIRVDFTRLTFVNKDATERVTIDVDLTCRNEVSSFAFPKLGIAEVKRDRTVTGSLFLRKVRELRLREGSISKYCLGIMSLYAEAKRNRFKERLNEIAKLAA